MRSNLSHPSLIRNYSDDLEAKIAQLEANADTSQNENAGLVDQVQRAEKTIKTQRQEIEEKFQHITYLWGNSARLNHIPHLAVLREEELARASGEKEKIEGQVRAVQATNNKLREQIKEGTLAQVHDSKIDLWM